MLRALPSFNMLCSLFADYFGNKNDRDATDTAQDVLLAATTEWVQEVRKHRSKLKLHVYYLVSQPLGPLMELSGLRSTRNPRQQRAWPS